MGILLLSFFVLCFAFSFFSENDKKPTLAGTWSFSEKFIFQIVKGQPVNHVRLRICNLCEITSITCSYTTPIHTLQADIKF